MIKKIAIGFLFLVLCMGAVAAASSNTVEYTGQSGIDRNNAHFIVKTLKYEPFPVNPGDWFDLWIVLENVGQEDATNLKTELQKDSTFEIQDPIRQYAIVPGTLSAYKYQQQLGDKNIETNQILLKYRVRVERSSSEGEENIRLSLSTDETSGSLSYDLPIDIEKTRTDFNVNLNMISPQGAEFDISNIGDSEAKALVVSVKDDNNVDFLQKYSPVTISSMESGDVKTALLRVLPKEGADSMSLEISYTDTANVRTTIEKKVSVSKEMIEASKTDFDATLNEISPRETVVAISNIGNFLAKSVSVEVKDEGNVIFLDKYTPVSIGDINSGETALVHLNLLPKENAKDLTVLIHYTDDANSRRTTEKKIPVTRNQIDALCPPSKDLSYLLWIYGAVGFLCGAFLIILSLVLVKGRKRKRRR